MKTYFIIILLLLGFGSLAQNCPEYGKLIKDGDNDTKLKQFKKALNNFNAAKLCSPSMASEVDKKINLLFEAIEKEKDEALNQKKEAEKAQSTADANLRKMSDLISEITNLIQDDKTNGIIGFTPFKSELLQILIPANQFISNNKNFEDKPWKSAIAHLQLGKSFDDIGNSAESNKEVDLAFFESKSLIQKYVKNKMKLPNDLTYNYLIAANLKIWNIVTSEDYDLAKKYIMETDQIVAGFDTKNAKINYALAGFENAKSYLFSQIKNDSLDNLYMQRAVSFSKNAVKIEPNNISYQISLAKHLNNLTITNSKLDTTNYKELKKNACEIYTKIANTSGTGFASYRGLVDCSRDESYTLVSKKKYNEAIKNLEITIKKINEAIHLDPKNIDYVIDRSWLLLRLSEILRHQKNDNTLSNKYLQLSVNDWIEFVKKNTTTYDLWKVKNIYGDISSLLTYDTEINKLDIFEKMNNAFIENEKLYGKITIVSQMITENYADLSEEYLNKESTSDSTKALSILEKATYYIENTDLISKQGGFKEIYAKFGKIYSNKISMLILKDKVEDAFNNYKVLNKILFPLFQKFQYDYYFRQHFVGSAMRLGRKLYLNKRYIESIPILEYASKNGVKESSVYLSNIYRKGLSGEKKIMLADSLEKLSKKQYLKKFTIPCDFGGKKAPFDVYVEEYSKDYPYKGIDDQAEWLKQARGGTIPKDVRESFIKLQKIAWDNDVSYPDLCVYALDAANEGNAIDKYKSFKKEITEEKDKIKKRSLYKKLFEVYENDISKESDKKSLEFIKKDASEFYSEYANFLGKDDKIEKNKIFSRILEFDPKNKSANENSVTVEFELNMGNPEILCQTKNLGRLKTYLKLYLEQQNRKSADIVLNKILTIEDNTEIRYEMNQLYYLFGLSKFESLFLSDTKKIELYRSFFINTRKKISSNYSKQMLYYMELIKLDEAYLKIKSDTITKKEVAQHYNSLSWNCLLSKDYNIFKYLERSIELDASSPYPKGNLPHFYLFNNKVGKAKELYLKFKDLPFDKKGGYPTFKDAFLSDFKDFEKEGITHEKLNEIKELLMK